MQQQYPLLHRLLFRINMKQLCNFKQVEDSDFLCGRGRTRNDSSIYRYVPLVGLQPLEVLIFALSNERCGFGCHGGRSLWFVWLSTYPPIGTL